LVEKVDSKKIKVVAESPHLKNSKMWWFEGADVFSYYELANLSGALHLKSLITCQHPNIR